MQGTDLPVALVLGAKVAAGGRASAALQRRASHAAALWQAGEVRAIVASGAHRWHPPSEAQVIARICRDAGVPDAVLFLEEGATTTAENLTRSVPILRALDATEVLLVTDRAHGRRAALVARRMGLSVRVSPPPEPPFRPSDLSRALREAAAFVLYWLRGTGGG